MIINLKNYTGLKLLYATIVFILLATLMPLQIKVLLNSNSVSLPWDKVAHFLMFMILGYLIPNAISSTPSRIKFVCIGIFIAIGTEVAQQYIPGRGLELWDAIMDLTGLIVGYLLYALLNYYLFKSR